MAIQVAVDRLTFRVSQRRKSFFAHQLFHSWQEILPFRHRSEPRIRHSVRDSMASKRLPMAGAAPLCEYAAVGCIQLRDVSQYPAASSERQQGRQT